MKKLLFTEAQFTCGQVASRAEEITQGEIWLYTSDARCPQGRRRGRGPPRAATEWPCRGSPAGGSQSRWNRDLSWRSDLRRNYMS